MAPLLQVLAQRTEILCMLHPVAAAVTASWAGGTPAPPQRPEAAMPQLTQKAARTAPQAQQMREV